MNRARLRSGALPETSPLTIVVMLGCIGLASLVGVETARERAAQAAFRTPGFVAQADDALNLQKMVEEIQDSGAIFYPPVPGARPGDSEQGPVAAGGVGVINARGEPIMYYVDDLEQDLIKGGTKPRHLFRTNLKDGTTTTLVTGVTGFLAIIPPIRAGKPVAKVNLQLTATDTSGGKGKGKGKEEHLDWVTSVVIPAAIKQGPDPR